MQTTVWNSYCKEIAASCDGGAILDMAGKILAVEGIKAFSDAEAKKVALALNATSAKMMPDMQKDGLKIGDVAFTGKSSSAAARLMSAPDVGLTIAKTHYVILLAMSKAHSAKDEAVALAPVLAKVKDEGY